MRKIILKHRRKNERIELTKEEFQKKFCDEITYGIESLIATSKVTNRLTGGYRKEATESDYWFDLRWNFNNYSICEYYIERII